MTAIQTEEALDDEPFTHELTYSGDGDGWNEPLSQQWACQCGVVFADWTQTDPECTGSPDMEEMLAEHGRHLAAIYAQPKALPALTSSVAQLATAAKSVLGDVDAVFDQMREQARVDMQARFEQRVSDLRREFERQVTSLTRRAESAEAGAR